MRTTLRYILLSPLLLVLGYTQAQDTPVVAPPMVDTFAVDEEEYEDHYEGIDNNNLLYFTGKEDTTALYDSSVVVWRSVPDSLVQQLKHEDAFWYVDKDLQKKKREEKKKDLSWWQRLLEALFDILSNPIVRQILFYCIIFLFVAATTWFLINNQMNIFGKSKGRLKTNRDELSGEDILSRDLDKMLREAENSKAYRLAVRVRYLQLLKLLSERQLIQYRDDATNMEYLTQLYGKSFYQPFFSITRHYEYVWYGEAEVAESVYQRLTNDFNSLHQTIITA